MEMPSDFPTTPLLPIHRHSFLPEDDWVRARRAERDQAMIEFVTKAALGETRQPRSPEEMERLQEKFRAFKERATIFRHTEHQKQWMFRNANCRSRIFIGGNQSGKTTANLAEAVAWCEGYYPWTGERVRRLDGTVVTPPVRVMVGAIDFANSVAGNIIPKLKELIPFDVYVTHQERMQGGVVHRIVWHNGSEIKLMSYQMDDFAYEGYTWDAVLWDEPPPHSKYIATQRGCVKKSAPNLFSFTPIKEPWIKDHFLDSPDAIHCKVPDDLVRLKKNSTFVVNVDFLENPYIQEEEKVLFWEKLNEEQREARIHGRYAHLMGRIYPEFDPAVHMVDDDYLPNLARQMQESDPEFPDWNRWPIGVVCDPHDRKPYFLGLFCVTPREDIVFFEEFPAFDFFDSRRNPYSIQDVADWIHTRIEENQFSQVLWYVIDPRFGHAPKATTGTTLIQEFSMLEENAIYWDAAFKSPDREAGRALVKRRLKDHSLFFTRRCANMQRGLENHTWKDHRSRVDERALMEDEEDKFKDPCDVMRYALEAKPGWVDPKTWSQKRYPSMWHDTPRRGIRDLFAQ